MAAPINYPGFSILIDYQFPGSDLIAVLPYALPLLFIGIIMVLYQRYMDPDSIKRKLVISGGIITLLATCALVIYGGYGSYWWGPDELTLGSWDVFIAGLQWTTDFMFGDVLIGTGYLIGIAILFAIMGKLVIAPSNPDFVKINEELKEAKDAAESSRTELQKLEAENKQLNEFMREKEASLSTLQSEIDELKELVSEPTLPVETVAVDVDEGREAEHLALVAEKDRTIGTLQDEIVQLKAAVSAAPSPASAVLETPIADEAATQLDELRRRADTASQVIDSIISDLVELISQVESSGLEPSAKEALRGLIEGLGRRISQVAGTPEERITGEPKVELIGAVTMIQEIVDGIKKLTRGS